MTETNETTLNIQHFFFNHLENRFHVVGRLFSSKSRMTSKCGENRGKCECVTDVPTKFDVLHDLILN